MKLFTKRKKTKSVKDTKTSPPTRGLYKTEVGKTGLQQSYGYPSEEFLLALSGANGIRTYREMADNDPIVGGILFAVKQILRELRWSVRGGEDENKEFLEENMASMQHTWLDLIIEISSMFIYGWATMEQVYEVREGKNCWKKMPIRSQSSLDRWEIADNGDTLGLYQCPAPDYEEIYIPMHKLMHFRTEHFANNPEGRSILRNAYRPYFMKKSIEEIEAVGVERDLVGMPVITLPEGMKVDGDEEATEAIGWAKKIVTNIRNDEQAGIVLPYGWEFELAASPGNKAFDTSGIIRRYSTEISVTVLAQFIMLGMERTGSYALSNNITDMFYLCIEGWADVIASTINNQAVKTLFALNGITDDIPQIVHTAIRRDSLENLSRYVSTLIGVDAMTITEDLKEYLVKYARLESFSDVRK